MLNPACQGVFEGLRARPQDVANIAQIRSAPINVEDLDIHERPRLQGSGNCFSSSATLAILARRLTRESVNAFPLVPDEIGYRGNRAARLR